MVPLLHTCTINILEDNLVKIQLNFKYNNNRLPTTGNLILSAIADKPINVAIINITTSKLFIVIKITKAV
jgi:hypothetical protein